MIPEKIGTSITTIRDKDVGSVVNWFDQHMQLLYPLGLIFLHNQQHMEELFYRSILKVHKDLPRFKSETSFEMWVISIFIGYCREINGNRSFQTPEEDEPRHDLIKALDQLKEAEKEVLVLNLVTGFTQEETAYILQVSVDKIKELLFSGIQTLRTQLGYGTNFNGCKEYQKGYIDYLDKTMIRSEKIDFEIHIYHCESCQDDLATFQEVLLTMKNLSDRMEDFYVATGLMENIQARLYAREKEHQQKINKRKKVGLVFLSIFTLFIGIGYFTGAFADLYYKSTEEDEQLLAFLQHDLGKMVNLEAESEGVKIRIKSVIADDVQTLVFYEITDTEEDNQYFMNYDDGLVVENAYEVMNNEIYPRYYPLDIEAEVNKKEKNVFHGRVSLQPIKTDNATINLKITNLIKLVRAEDQPSGFNPYGGNQRKSGEWSFEIPVTKQPSTEYTLNKEMEIEGIPVRFDQLNVSPTATTLQYSIKTTQTERHIDSLHFEDLEVNSKKVKVADYGGYFMNSQQDMNWSAFQMMYDPIFGEEPKEVSVRLKSAYLTVDDQKKVELDVSQEYPQTFEYAGSTISIDKIEVGIPTNIEISDYELENRTYENFHFNIVGENESQPLEMELDIEGVLIDKNGVKYDPMEVTHFTYEEMEEPRHFVTVQKIKLHGSKVIPKRLDIFGYSSMKYLDDVIKIRLD